MRKNVTILGAGSFGTVIANVIAENGNEVILYVRDLQLASFISEKHINYRYLPDYALSTNIKISTNLGEATKNADIIFFCVPSNAFRKIAQDINKLIRPDTIIISATKGVEADGFKLMSQVLAEYIPQAQIGVISGPNLAKEIAERQFTGTVVCSENANVKEIVPELLHNSYLRVYTGSDVYGVELAGALKNIYAIMSGFAASLNLGSNTITLLITRGLAEMSRFAVELGANPLTFIGLAGIGDLMATCMSPLSRNYQVGYALGKGEALEDIVKRLGQVAEGINTLKLVKNKAEQLDVYMPLVSALYKLVFEDVSLEELINSMMQAQRNTDVEFILTMNSGESSKKKN